MIEAIYEQWYFHRVDLARSLLATLFEGTGDPIALMGERRIGKTSFLVKDLIPAAHARGMVSVYVDIWQQRHDPLVAINYALQEAIDDLEVPTTKTARRLATTIKKIGLAGGSIDFGDEPIRKRPDSPYVLIDWLLKSLLRAAGKPVLLVFDEIQELATVKDGENIVSALRSAITKSRAYVRVIFTGSSEAALMELLSRSRAALYEGASRIAFPRLDEKFIQFVAKTAKARLGRMIAEKDLQTAFERLHHRPRPLIDLVLLFASTGRGKGIATLLDDQVEAQLDSPEYGQQWQTLKPLYRLICERIARGDEVSSMAALQAYGAKGAAVSPGTVSSALRALQTMHVTVRNAGQRGSYRLDDPLFAEWIRRKR